jgi:hypothetical protein
MTNNAATVPELSHYAFGASGNLVNIARTSSIIVNLIGAAGVGIESMVLNWAPGATSTMGGQGSFTTNVNPLLMSWHTADQWLTSDLLGPIECLSSIPLYWRGSATASVINACEAAKVVVSTFQSLGPDWDGYGAVPISETARSNATRVLDIIEAMPVSLPTPEISPNPNGTISMEWDTEDAEAYIEIGNTRFSGYIRSSDASPVYLQGDAARLDQSVLVLIQESLFASSSSRSAAISNIWIQGPERERLAA